MVSQRKIIHIDMDAFFASVEQRKEPLLKNRPVVIGGLPNERGVVSSASYQARRCGVRSAMSSALAQRLCPQAVFMRPNFPLYKEASQEVMQIFSRYSQKIEPLSVDEAYLDVTQDVGNHQGSATLLTREILQKIEKETYLTASAGISNGKFFAKVASEQNKPNGHFVLPPSQIQPFIYKLPIGKFYGIGKITATKLKNMGIINGEGLSLLSMAQMHALFGKSSSFYRDILIGVDSRPVMARQQQKSLGAEKTFTHDISELSMLDAKLAELCHKVFSRLQKNWGSTLTVKIKLNNFQVMTRSQSGFLRFVSLAQFYNEVRKIFLTLYQEAPLPIRLLGVTVSNLSQVGSDKKQLLFDF